MPTREVDRNELAGQLLSAWCDAIVRLGAARTGKSIIVDKITPYSGTARSVRSQIRRHHPESKTIHLSRDGRDVVTSLVFDWMHREPIDSPRRQLMIGQSQGIRLDRFFTDEDLSRWGGLWLETEEAFASLPDQLEVRYEDLQADMPRQIARILEFLGASCEPETVQSMCDATSFDKMKRVSGTPGAPFAKARRGVVGDWMQYFTRRDGEIFESVTDGKLVAMGYAESDRWWEHCPERIELRSRMEA
jgi:hypothetical protein